MPSNEDFLFQTTRIHTHDGRQNGCEWVLLLQTKANIH